MQGILFNFSFHVFTIEWKVVVAIPSNEFSEPTLLTNVIELYDMLIVIPVIKLQSPEMYICAVEFVWSSTVTAPIVLLKTEMKMILEF